jgi:hypothetical protein
VRVHLRWPRRRVLAATATILVATSCTSPTVPSPGTSSSSFAAQPTSTTAAPGQAPAARPVDWFDLDVGECLADPPPTDPNVIAVSVVDCATPHHAEVFRRASLAVGTAIADVATAVCDDGFTAYTGEPVGSGTFTITYLIDSNQNRTSSNPNPSTVICMLEAVDGAPLTVPARR